MFVALGRSAVAPNDKQCTRPFSTRHEVTLLGIGRATVFVRTKARRPLERPISLLNIDVY